MIRINLAPERGRRPGAGFSFSLPAFNLAWLFGVIYLALLLGVGVYWWVLISTKANLTADITYNTTTADGSSARVRAWWRAGHWPRSNCFAAVRGESLRIAPHLHITDADCERLRDALTAAMQ